MPQGYHHLTHNQRCQIYGLMKSGVSQSQIAKELKISQPTVSRELKRNSGKRGYRFKQAQEKALKRRHDASSQPYKMTLAFTKEVGRLLTKELWSPDQISGRLNNKDEKIISRESIYRYIRLNRRNGGDLYKSLRRGGKKYNKRLGKIAGRGVISNRIGIEHRPPEVAAKIRVGDFEIDTIIGAYHKGALLSIVDRVTKVSFFVLLSSTKSEETAEALIKRLDPIRDYVHTITSDNGKEFAEHEFVSQKLDTKFFFANPYHSWERGLNENTNGLARQRFPKGSDFTKLTKKDVLEFELKLNNRPRKSLGYNTPNEEFLRLTGIDLRNYALHC